MTTDVKNLVNLLLQDFPDISPNSYDINNMKFDFMLKILPNFWSTLNGEKENTFLWRLIKLQISKLNLYDLVTPKKICNILEVDTY